MGTFTLRLSEAIEFKPLDVSRETFFGLASYPIFDRKPDGTSVYAPLLTNKIIDHYWNREIGMETVPMFEFAMRRKMNEIMPYYNQLYETERLTFDPLKNIDMRTVMTGESGAITTNAADATGETKSQSKSRSVTFDTPQTMLSGNEDYASGGSDVSSDSTGESKNAETSTSKTDADQNSVSTTSGYQGNMSEMLNAFRGTLLNIDMMVIRDLNELFMQVWNNNDEMLPPGIEGGFFL